MNNRSMTEWEFVQKCLPLFRERFDVAFLEVPIFAGSADMVGIKKGRISAIEFKVTNWRRATAQAVKHSLAVDFVYICIPKPKTIKSRRTIEAYVSEAHVGLFYFEEIDGPEIQEAVPASCSDSMWPSAKKSLQRLLRLRAEGGGRVGEASEDGTLRDNRRTEVHRPISQ